MKERLQKILARAGIGSRRRAEQFIMQGRVSVDNRVVTEMGLKVDPALHRIKFDGKPIEYGKKKVYYLLNKPSGYVSTLSDPQGRPIVSSLLKGVTERIFPVGRLDLDTKGALIFTNDGELAQRILHPSNEINRTYVARIKGIPSGKELVRLENGIEIEGRRTWPACVRILETGRFSATVEIIIHEGKKRQVRKMFAAFGHPVAGLKRTAYGALRLGRLREGEFRSLSPKDMGLIFSKVLNRCDFF